VEHCAGFIRRRTPAAALVGTQYSCMTLTHYKFNNKLAVWLVAAILVGGTVTNHPETQLTDVESTPSTYKLVGK